MILVWFFTSYLLTPAGVYPGEGRISPDFIPLLILPVVLDTSFSCSLLCPAALIPFLSPVCEFMFVVTV